MINGEEIRQDNDAMEEERFSFGWELCKNKQTESVEKKMNEKVLIKCNDKTSLLLLMFVQFQLYAASKKKNGKLILNCCETKENYDKNTRLVLQLLESRFQVLNTQT